MRQRLEVMLSARDEPAGPLGERPAESPKLDLETYGSVYVGYRRESHFTDVFGEELTDSTIFADGFLSTRLRSNGYRYRIETSGGYRYDLIEGEHETRTRSLFFRFDDERRDLSVIAGRQTRSQGGVLGRFDGVFGSVRTGERFELRAVAGFPVDYTSYNKVDFDRQFFGFSVDVAAFSEALDVEVFAIQQMADGMIDRRAVGAEVRYADATRFIAGFLDYDMHFNSLNVALLTGNWQIEPHTRVNFLADYRNVPVLTARNALQGQTVADLADLQDFFSDDEIDDLAQDRTAKSATLGAGVSHDLRDWLQFALDANATWLSGTPDSGGVEGMDGQGVGLTSLAQLIASDLVKTGDVGVLGLRATHGFNADTATLSVDLRLPVGRALRVNPRIAARYRYQEGKSAFALLPVLRADLRLGSLIFDFEGGIEWSIPPDTPDVNDEWGYTMSFGVRRDF